MSFKHQIKKIIIWTNVNNRSKTFESTYFNESFLVKSKTAQKKPESKQIKIESDKVNLKYFSYIFGPIFFKNTNESKITSIYQNKRL